MARYMERRLGSHAQPYTLDVHDAYIRFIGRWLEMGERYDDALFRNLILPAVVERFGTANGLLREHAEHGDPLYITYILGYQRMTDYAETPYEIANIFRHDINLLAQEGYVSHRQATELLEAINTSLEFLLRSRVFRGRGWIL